MACIEVFTFRLVPDTDERAFLDADHRVQQGFAYQQAGLLRRTTARNDDGEWLVIDLWESTAAADAMAERWDADPFARSFMAFVEQSTVAVRRYETLD